MHSGVGCDPQSVVQKAPKDENVAPSTERRCILELQIRRSPKRTSRDALDRGSLVVLGTDFRRCHPQNRVWHL